MCILRFPLRTLAISKTFTSNLVYSITMLMSQTVDGIYHLGLLDLIIFYFFNFPLKYINRFGDTPQKPYKIAKFIFNFEWFCRLTIQSYLLKIIIIISNYYRLRGNGNPCVNRYVVSY